MTEPRRFRKACKAVSAETGRRCALLEGHADEHAAGSERFRLVAPDGATTFRRADELDRHALARPTSHWGTT